MHPDSPPLPPTGQQVTIRWRDHEVITCAVAAGLRSYRVGDRPLVDGFAANAYPDGARGQTLIPWPNRIADGRYAFGEGQQLSLTEPAAGNAIHGLARWVAWSAQQVSPEAVTWQHFVPPQPGWPTWLDCRVRYTIGPKGLIVETWARNVGDRSCLYGTGAHPYLAAGPGLIDDCELTVPAGTWFAVDDRKLPIDERPITGQSIDFRQPSRIGSQVIDHAFGSLARGGDGRWEVSLSGPSGRVCLWAGAAYRYVQVFTGDTLAPHAARRGLAVEPMTCPPNAFNAADRTGQGVIELVPGAEHHAQWGIYQPVLGPS